jgi:uncharacterized protein (TIRG00374 family)
MSDPRSAGAAAPDSPRSLRRVEYWVIGGMAAFVAVVALLSFWAGAETVLAPMRQLSWRLVAALLGLSLLNYLLRAWRWQIFSDGLGVHVPWRRNLLYFFAGFAMTTTPGKTGEALRLWFMERCHFYPYERTAPLFVGDRLSDMAAITLFCLVGVGAFAGYADATLATAALLLLVLLPFLHPPLLRWAMRRIERPVGRRFPRLWHRLEIALNDTARLFRPRLFGLGLLLALAGWAAEIYEFHLLLDGVGAAVTLQQASFIFTFAMIAGTLAMLPGGLGGIEAVMLALLSAIGIEFGTALAATAVIRLTTLWFATFLGFLALPFAMRSARRMPQPVAEGAP